MLEHVYNICISNQKDQIQFAKICSKFDFDINLCKGSYEVDAKSVLGVCSMDTSNGCKVKINALNTNQIEKFLESIKQYIRK